MKNILKLNTLVFILQRGLLSIAMLGLLTLQAMAAEQEIFKVSISPAVKEQIQKAGPDEREKLEVAINAGNKFIPYHFDGRAYDGNLEEWWKFWKRNIRPLINRDAREWFGSIPVHVSTPYAPIERRSEWLGLSMPSVCPKIELVSMITIDRHSDDGWKEWYPQNFEEDNFVLEYQAKFIGDLIDSGLASRHFEPSKYGEYETVLVGLGKNNKVNHVASQYADRTWTAERQIEILKSHSSGILSGDVAADDKARLKQMIQDIEFQKNKVCKDAPL